MRTARLLPVSPWSGGVYLVRGCTWSGGCNWSQGCVSGLGVYLVQGVPGLGGAPGPGGCTWSGGYYAQVLPPWNRMTDRCKNITLPQTSFAGGKNAKRLVTSSTHRNIKVIPGACFYRGEAPNSPITIRVSAHVTNFSDRDIGKYVVAENFQRSWELLLPTARKGNVFRSVCHSVHI